MEELIMSLNHIKHFAYQESNHFLFAILKSDFTPLAFEVDRLLKGGKTVLKAWTSRPIGGLFSV